MPHVSDRLRRRSVQRWSSVGADGETTLETLPTGARAIITHVANGDDALVRRLCDLGFSPGTEVEVLRRAPLGDPVVYRIRDFEICLRDRQAASIRVQALTSRAQG